MSAADTNLERWRLPSDLGAESARSALGAEGGHGHCRPGPDRGLEFHPEHRVGTLADARALRRLRAGVFALPVSQFIQPGAAAGAAECTGTVALSRTVEDNTLGRVLWIQAAVALVITVVLGIAAGIAQLSGHPDLSGALYGLTLGAPCYLLLSLARSACYVEMAPGRAASAASRLLRADARRRLGGFQKSLISPFAVFVLMGIASLAAGALIFAQTKPEAAVRARLYPACAVFSQTTRLNLPFG